MSKKTRSRYTLEFKKEAVRLIRGGVTLAEGARQLGVVSQTLHAWVKADSKGQLAGAGHVVSAQEMELARLRRELQRVTMERDILKKATAYFAKESL